MEFDKYIHLRGGYIVNMENKRPILRARMRK